MHRPVRYSLGTNRTPASAPRIFQDADDGYAYLREDFIADASYFIVASKSFCSLMMVDIDNLTQINRQHGEQVGDAVLETCMSLLGEHEGIWTYGRCGDDTFFSILPMLGLNSSRPIAQRFCNTLKTFDWQQVAPNLRVTCSIGYVEAVTKEPTDDTVARAVAGFRMAKAQGGDRAHLGPRYLAPWAPSRTHPPSYQQPKISEWAKSNISTGSAKPAPTQHASRGDWGADRRTWNFS